MTHFADDATLAYISRIERERAELIDALKEMINEVDSFSDITFTRDIEPYKAEANWDYVYGNAMTTLSRMESK